MLVPNNELTLKNEGKFLSGMRIEHKIETSFSTAPFSELLLLLVCIQSTSTELQEKEYWPCFEVFLSPYDCSSSAFSTSVVRIASCSLTDVLSKWEHGFSPCSAVVHFVHCIIECALQTLLDLFVLHRSEVLRLVVLYLSRSPFRAGLALLARLVFAFTADLNARIARFDGELDITRASVTKAPFGRFSPDGNLLE